MINKSHRKIIIAFIALGVIGAGLYWRQPIAKATMKIFYGLSVQNGLVGYWNFDECDTCTTAADKSGSGNTGTMYKEAGPTVGDLHTSSGKIGNGISLDGSNDYVGVSASASLSLGTTMTISMWFNQRVATGLQALASSNKYYGAGFNGNWLLRIDSGASIDFASYNGQADAEFQLSPFTINNNVWNHVVVSINGVTATTYFNGVASASGPFTHTKALIDAGVSGMSIGDDLNWANEPFNGLIDDVRIYNRALSAGEVRYLAEQKGDATIRSSNKNGLVGYWNFDECDTCTTAADKSGSGNTGTMYNAAGQTIGDVHTPSGKIGNGISLDGSDDYVNIGDTASVDFGAGDFTLTAWVKLASTNTRDVIIAKDVSGARQFSVILNSDTNANVQAGMVIAGVFVNSGQSRSIQTDAGLVDTGWRHVVVVRRAGPLEVFVDGVQRTVSGTQPASGEVMDPTAASLEIGRRTFGGYEDPFHGQIDDVRIYNRALSADEIARLYEEGSYRTTINANQNSSFNSGLVGMWSFNGPDVDWASTTAEILDRSGNGKNGDAVSSTKNDVRTGIVGQALNFDGVDDYVNIGDTASVDFGAGDFTLTAWVKLASTNTRDTVMAKDVSGARQFSLILNTDTSANVQAGTVMFAMFVDSGQGRSIQTDAGLVDTGWRHVVVVRRAGPLEVFVDGVQRTVSGTQPASGEVLDPTAASLEIGRRTFGGYEDQFHGQIDDVRVYNRALNAAEIQELYLSSARQ